MTEPTPRVTNSDRLGAESVGATVLSAALSIATRAASDVRMEDVLALGRQLAPELFGDGSILAAAQAPRVVQEFRERASAEGRIHGVSVSPRDLLDQEITQLRTLVHAPVTTSVLRDRLAQLHAAREWLSHKPSTETRLLRHDVFGAARKQLPVGMVSGDYREYRLASGRRLRLLMLHPDHPEHSTGADLLYEICWPQRSLTRFSLVQYKLWNGRRLYFSGDRRMEEQVRRLRNCTCEAGYCKSRPRRPSRFRLPFCASFLRPTDRLQPDRIGRVSRGLYVPACALEHASTRTRRGEKTIGKKEAVKNGVSSRVFEELFACNLLGSDWVSYAEMQEFYATHRIPGRDNRYLLHVQEAESG